MPTPPRRGFIILFGTRNIGSREGGPGAQTRCPGCNTVANFVGKRYRTWFTLFFIPIFPVSGAQRVSECTVCGAAYRVPIEDLRGQAAGNSGREYQEAITLYNRLRENPTDSVLLFQLMQAYVAMGEPGEAAAATRHFPQALEASSQCKDLLARIQAAPAQQ